MLNNDSSVDPAQPKIYPVDSDADFYGLGYTDLTSTGDSIQLYRVLKNQLYPCTLSSVTPFGHYIIDYDDVETDTVNICVVTWRYDPTRTITTLTSTLRELT